MSQRPVPVDELVNAFEFEEAAKAALPASVFSTIAGSDRAALDRMTFRPRMNVPTLDLDLSLDLFGQRHFAPILVGPVSEQRRFHSDGELATVRGAAAARAGVIVSSRSSAPLAEIAAARQTPLWLAVYADDLAASERRIRDAVTAGCSALCITIGGHNRPRAATPPRIDWTAIDRVRKSASVPVVVKGIPDAAAAGAALDHGVQGVAASSVETVSAIADRVRAKAVVLADGNFRRGSDLLKALILGAQAVIVSRPVMWALASYGSDGVRSVLELLQSDLARQFGAIGASNASKLTRDMVRVHRR